jgi:hypothetical protein
MMEAAYFSETSVFVYNPEDHTSELTTVELSSLKMTQILVA